MNCIFFHFPHHILPTSLDPHDASSALIVIVTFMSTIILSLSHSNLSFSFHICFVFSRCSLWRILSHMSVSNFFVIVNRFSLLHICHCLFSLCCFFTFQESSSSNCFFATHYYHCYLQQSNSIFSKSFIIFHRSFLFTLSLPVFCKLSHIIFSPQ